MRISIYNLHNMCENNTLFLSRAWRYFNLNGHSVNAGDGVDLAFIGGCAVTDTMRSRCEKTVLNLMQMIPQARIVIFGCLASFPEGFKKATGKDIDRLYLISYRDSRELDKLVHARIPFEVVHASRLRGHVPYQPCMGPEDCYVHISLGCVNDCSYCNIKIAKGSVQSRTPESIEDEVRDLYDRGIRMVTLLADDCGSYGLDRGADFPGLLARLNAVLPEMRYKIFTIFPALFLRQAAQLEPHFAARRVPYVCLPVQSAAPRILNLMNRRYDPDELAEAVGRLRALDPELFVYSHFIFNFPTETWEEFEQSIAFARHFDHCVFIGYGENKATRAAGLTPKCDEKTLQDKARHLTELVGCGDLAAFVVMNP
jgi:tRNA A37 methylthiotransferase MiaB